MKTSTFADALRKVWKDSGLRQEEFAKRLAYSRPTVANMMRGTHLPPLELLSTAEEVFPGSREVLEPLLQKERQGREREKERRTLTRRAPMWDAEGIDLSGTWYAIWETTVEGESNINTEVLRASRLATT